MFGTNKTGKMVLFSCFAMLFALNGLCLADSKVSKPPAPDVVSDRANRHYVIASSNNFPPVNKLDTNGNLVGFGRDVADAVVEAIGGTRVHIHSSIWSDVVNWLKSGQADFIHDTGYNRERTAFLDYSEPILTMTEEIFVKTDRFDITDLNSLKNRKVACVDKHISHLYLKHFSDIECLVVHSPIDGLFALLDDEVVAFIFPRQVMLHLLQTLDASNRVKVVGEPLRKLTWHMTVRKGDKKMLDLLNQGIARIKASGQYDKIYDRWFGRFNTLGYTRKEVTFVAALVALLSLVVGGLFMLFLYVRRLAKIQKKLTKTIEEQEQIEKALRDSEERFSLAMRGANDGLWDWDLKSNEVYYSPRWCGMLGYGVDELETNFSTWEHLVSPDDRNRVLNLAQDYISGKTDNYKAEYRMLHKNGTWLTFLTRGFLVIENEKPLRLVGTHVDITERRRAEDELRNHRDNLEALVAERTADLEMKTEELKLAYIQEKEYNQIQQEFVSLVSHEFHTPLSIIDSSAQRLVRQKNNVTSSEIKSRVKKIRSAVQRLIGLVDRTLHASRLDAGKIEINLAPCDLQSLLHEVCNRQIEITPSHNISLDINNLSKEMLVDYRLLEIVFSNLLSNAIKYSPDHPTVHVYSKTAKDGLLSISVTDKGIGISKKDLPHIFKRFFRARTAEGYRGTGIGLNISKEFVLMHGGHIEVDSKKDEGSTFTVYLPIAASAAIPHEVEREDGNVPYRNTQ